MAVSFPNAPGRNHGEADNDIFLARIIEGGSPGSLTESLLKNQTKSLRDSFRRLAPDKQKEYREKLGKRLLRSLFFLASENDKKIYNRDLLNLARQLYKEDKKEIALALLHELQSQKKYPGIYEDAKRLHEAILGKGSAALRAELFLDDFVHQVTEPSSILAMVAGGLAFRATRLASLKRFFRGPVPNTLTQVWGRRILANTLSLGAESIAFTGTAKLTQSAMGKDVDYSAESWGTELAGTAILLGNLRLFGWGAGLAGKSLSQRFAFGSFSQRALQQLGMYTGIMSAKGLESWTNLHPNLPGGNYWTQGLATLLHFNAVGLLAWKLTPKQFQRWESKLDQQANKLLFQKTSTPVSNRSEDFRRSLLPFQTSPILAIAWEGGPGKKGLTIQPAERPPVSLSEWKPYDGELHLSWNQLTEKLAERGTPRTYDTIKAIERMYPYFRDRLYRTHIKDPHQLEGGLQRLEHTLQSTPGEEARGSYADWLTRTAFEQLFERPSPLHLDLLLGSLYDGTPLTTFEALLAPSLPKARLKKLPGFYRVAFLRDHIAREANQIKMSKGAKETLLRWVIDPDYGMIDNPFLFDRNDFLERLNTAIADPNNKPLIEGALTAMGDSPLALFRMTRLYQILRHEYGVGMEVKLRELADPNARLLSFTERTQPPASPERIDGTHLNAYFSDPRMAGIFTEIYHTLPTLLRTSEAVQRTFLRDSRLHAFLDQRTARGNLQNSDIVEAFEHLGDPISKKIATEIKRESFGLIILPKLQFEETVDRVQGRKGYSKSIYSLYAPPGLMGPKGVMLIREKPLGSYSREVAPTKIFEALTDVVHEFEHHEHMPPNTNGISRGLGLKQDTMAFAQEYYWRALHGDSQFFIEANREGNAGIAMYLRNYAERYLYPHIKRVVRY